MHFETLDCIFFVQPFPLRIAVQVLDNLEIVSVLNVITTLNIIQAVNVMNFNAQSNKSPRAKCNIFLTLNVITYPTVNVINFVITQ